MESIEMVSLTESCKSDLQNLAQMNFLLQEPRNDNKKKIIKQGTMNGCTIFFSIMRLSVPKKFINTVQKCILSMYVKQQKFQSAYLQGIRDEFSAKKNQNYSVAEHFPNSKFIFCLNDLNSLISSNFLLILMVGSSLAPKLPIMVPFEPNYFIHFNVRHPVQ